MYEQMLLQIGLLGEMLVTLWTNMLLLFMMNFFDMPVQCIFGAQNHFTLTTMQLLRSLMHLLDMLLQGFGIQVDFSTLFTRFLHGLLLTMYSILVFDQTVVGLKSFGTVLALEW